MRYATGTLIGQRGIRLTHASWLPETTPRGVVILVHGYGEHMGRHQHTIEALVEHEYAVHSLDHRGHGNSAGVRAHIERFDYFIDDLHLLLQRAKHAHPGSPLFMLGHSMGGLIAARYALRHQEQLNGLILSGAAIKIGENISPWLHHIGKALSLLLPTLPVTSPTRGTDSVLSRDPLIQEQFNADPLTYKGKLRARMGIELARAAADTRIHLHRLRLPLLVLHGADDKLTNPEGSRMLYEQASSEDKTLKLWPGCRHEILNEPEQYEVMAYLVEWLDQRVQKATPPIARLQPA
jgi:alpha-beta hydrolase superfamily lysophospholipase